MSKREKLEKKLEDMRTEHRAVWEQYGSELCAGEMIAKEEKLENQIKNLKDE